MAYEGNAQADGGDAWQVLFDVDLPVTPATTLSYLLFPRFVEGDLAYPSTWVALDLAFDDGSRLSDLGALDQHGFGVS
ncbi:hypothetical protein, partial [Paraburkholderia sp. SIMBA_053]|uniref:hypothetical protein n=1 Tax=Paraburkholderia sp. SIMBA_053 TaxID=3085794 RepID=UPI00397C45F4